MATPDTFYADVKYMFDNLPSKALLVARRSIFDLCEIVVQTTPVDTGFLRGSWQPAIGEQESVAATNKGDAGAKSSVELSAVINGLTVGDIFTMVNGAAYAMRLEFGFVGADSLGRNYNQQGRFWVTTALGQWQQIVDKNTAAVFQ